MEMNSLSITVRRIEGDLRDGVIGRVIDERVVVGVHRVAVSGRVPPGICIVVTAGVVVRAPSRGVVVVVV